MCVYCFSHFARQPETGKELHSSVKKNYVSLTNTTSIMSRRRHTKNPRNVNVINASLGLGKAILNVPSSLASLAGYTTRKISERWNRSATEKKKKDKEKQDEETRNYKNANRLGKMLHLLLKASSRDTCWIDYIMRADTTDSIAAANMIKNESWDSVTEEQFAVMSPVTNSAFLLQIIGECARLKYLHLTGGRLKAVDPSTFLDYAIGDFEKHLKKIYHKIPKPEKTRAAMMFVQCVVGSIARHFSKGGENPVQVLENHQQAVDDLFHYVDALLESKLVQKRIGQLEDPFAMGQVGLFWSSV